jgi:hypothetical protein
VTLQSLDALVPLLDALLRPLDSSVIPSEVDPYSRRKTRDWTLLKASRISKSGHEAPGHWGVSRFPPDLPAGGRTRSRVRPRSRQEHLT